MIDFGEILFGQGWSRWMPHSATVLIGVLSLQERPLTMDEIVAERGFDSPAVEDKGWDTEAWEPLELHTEESLAKLREDFPHGDDNKSADEINAEEAAAREQWRNRLDEVAQQLGVAPLVTMRDVLNYMVACRVLLASTEDGVTRYAVNPAPPLPTEVLAMTPEEIAKDDRIRWTHMYEEPSYRIIDLFEPDGAQHESLKTSLEKLARKIEKDPETARQAVLWLIEQGDFSANIDVATAEIHRVFQLHVDWDKFFASRISIRAGH
ncbi:DUF6042 family protein [Microbispora amethystogenes]|uniref:DUF6042 family protein n=1 Tax=Microbispora amethystogenes TaxID=1427754 RepID=UPI0033CD2032